MIRALPILLLLAACGETEPAPSELSPSTLAELNASPPPTRRFDPAALQRMKSDLLAQPSVAEVQLGDDPAEIDWHIGIKDLPDDDLVGPLDYARILCRRIRDAGLASDETDLRVYDHASILRRRSDPAGSDLAHVNCKTGDIAVAEASQQRSPLQGTATNDVA